MMQMINEFLYFIWTHPFSAINTLASCVIFVCAVSVVNAIVFKYKDPYCVGHILTGTGCFLNIVGPFFWGYNHPPVSEVVLNVGLALTLYAVVRARYYENIVETKVKS